MFVSASTVDQAIFVSLKEVQSSVLQDIIVLARLVITLIQQRETWKTLRSHVQKERTAIKLDYLLITSVLLVMLDTIVERQA